MSDAINNFMVMFLVSTEIYDDVYDTTAVFDLQGISGLVK